MKNDFGSVPLSHVYRGGTLGHYIKAQENCANTNNTSSLKSLAEGVLSRANQKNGLKGWSQNTVPEENNGGTDLSYGFEERAAIMEYDGGLSREEAEYLAGNEMKLLAGKK